MRIGVSRRGNWWVSLGCLGWLLLGPFILAGLFFYCLAMLAVLAVGGLISGGVWVVERLRQ